MRIETDGTPDPDGGWLGGGTTMVDLMKLGVAAPAALHEIPHRALDGIEATDDEITLRCSPILGQSLVVSKLLSGPPGRVA